MINLNNKIKVFNIHSDRARASERGWSCLYEVPKSNNKVSFEISATLFCLRTFCPKCLPRVQASTADKNGNTLPVAHCHILLRLSLHIFGKCHWGSHPIKSAPSVLRRICQTWCPLERTYCSRKSYSVHRTMFNFGHGIWTREKNQVVLDVRSYSRGPSAFSPEATRYFFSSFPRRN